jgi:hypothetical protein
MSSKAEAPANSERTTMTHTKDEALESLILKAGINPVMQGSCYVMHPEALQAVIDEAIKQALEQPVQEPVASLLAAIQAEPVTLIHKWRVLELVKDHAAQPAPVPDIEKWLGQPSYHDGFGRSPDLWSLVQIKVAVTAMLHTPPAPVPSTLPDFSPIFDGITKGQP